MSARLGKNAIKVGQHALGLFLGRFQGPGCQRHRIPLGRSLDQQLTLAGHLKVDSTADTMDHFDIFFDDSV